MPPSPFPLDALPGWLREHAAEIADAARVSPDAPALLLLAAVGAAAAKRVVVDYGRETHHTNLWTLAILPPSEGKTPLIQAVAEPFRRAQSELRRAARENEVDRRTDLSIQRIRRRQLAFTAATLQATAHEGALAARLALREVEATIARMEVVPEPTLVIEDATPEALVVAMAENDGVLTMISDEGSILFANAVRNSGELSNIESLLKSHSAEDIDHRRISRTSITVPEPVLSILIATQPRVVRGLLRRGAFDGRGLWERFLFVTPPSLVGELGDLGRLRLANTSLRWTESR